jgi:exodeoxyribonuclease-3
MKLLSWNVNGMRAALRKNFLDFLAAEAPDVIALQETKCTADDLPAEWQGYEPFWNSAEKKGYSGTGILTRKSPLSVSRGIGGAEHDREGRVLTLEFEAFTLVNVYVPNSQRELARLDYRQEWDRAFLAYLSGLQSHKPVVCCGDLNVAHQARDLAHLALERSHGGLAGRALRQRARERERSLELRRQVPAEGCLAREGLQRVLRNGEHAGALLGDGLLRTAQPLAQHEQRLLLDGLLRTVQPLTQLEQRLVITPSLRHVLRRRFPTLALSRPLSELRSRRAERVE